MFRFSLGNGTMKAINPKHVVAINIDKDESLNLPYAVFIETTKEIYQYTSGRVSSLDEAMVQWEWLIEDFESCINPEKEA